MKLYEEPIIALMPMAVDLLTLSSQPPEKDPTDNGLDDIFPM